MQNWAIKKVRPSLWLPHVGVVKKVRPSPSFPSLGVVKKVHPSSWLLNVGVVKKVYSSPTLQYLMENYIHVIGWMLPFSSFTS